MSLKSVEEARVAMAHARNRLLVLGTAIQDEAASAPTAKS